jgi:HAD superfamily hydrolase (TIGR01450 family)
MNKCLDAVILAAGFGSRLRPMTLEKPKTLIEVGGIPMLEYILNSLAKNGVQNVFIVVGYQKDKIIQFCKDNFSNLHFRFIENPIYFETNNMYSLYLAKDYLINDFYLMNADLVFDNEVITRLSKTDKTSIAVKKDVYLEESMKVKVNEGKIANISKSISSKEAYGVSIDVYKIIKKDISIIKSELDEIIDVDKNLHQWTEVMLDNLFTKRAIDAIPCDVSYLKWFEIDSYEDLLNAETLFNENLCLLKRKKIFFVDGDGTLILGDKIINGANDFLNVLKQKNKLTFLCTNNSSKTKHSHLKKFNSLNLNIDNVLDSLDCSLDYLKSKKIMNVGLLSTKEVKEYVLERGFKVDLKNPQVALLTYDNSLTYKKLISFINLVRKGIPYYATHADILCPTQNGQIPDIGCFIDMIKSSTGIYPEKVFGKPSIDLIKSTLDKLSLKESDAVVIGDRLYTDIAMCKDNQLTSVLVLSGETNRSMYEGSNIKADIILDSVKDLIKYF